MTEKKILKNELNSFDEKVLWLIENKRINLDCHSDRFWYFTVRGYTDVYTVTLNKETKAMTCTCLSKVFVEDVTKRCTHQASVYLQNEIWLDGQKDYPKKEVC